MKRLKVKVAVAMLGVMLMMNMAAHAQTEPWRTDQLIQPADLARIINDPNVAKPTIFNIGPSGRIKGSIEIGSTGDAANLKKLKEQAARLPKNASIVIYCGCCPFANCPNIRPAFQALSQMKFTNHKLLNIPKNLRVDWISKGYPMMTKD